MLQAVGAAKFLSEKKTSALSHKIAELLGASQAEDMIGTVTESDTKSGNEHVYYNIDAVTSALLEKKNCRSATSIPIFTAAGRTERTERGT